MTLPSSAPDRPTSPGSDPHWNTTTNQAPPGTDLGTDIGAAARFAGQALLRSPLALLGTGALYLFLLVAVGVVGFFVALMIMIAVVEAGPSTGGELTTGQVLLTIAVSFGVVLVVLPISLLWQAGAARAGGVLLEGGRPSFGEALIGGGRVLLTTALVLVATMIGTILLYLPGVIAAVLLMYAIPASVRGASPLAACKESFALARAHLGTTIVGFLLVMAASYLGSLILIGVIATIPFAMLFQLALYERVSGRAVPEPARG